MRKLRRSIMKFQYYTQNIEMVPMTKIRMSGIGNIWIIEN